MESQICNHEYNNRIAEYKMKKKIRTGFVGDPSDVAALLDGSWQTPIKQQKRTPSNKQGGVGRQQQQQE